MKRINGVLTPQNFDDAFGSWIIHTAGLMCGLCLRSKQRSGEYKGGAGVSQQPAVESSYYIPRSEWKDYSPSATKQHRQKRWYAYKRHIKTVHNGNWNLNQGFGKIEKGE